MNIRKSWFAALILVTGSAILGPAFAAGNGQHPDDKKEADKQQPHPGNEQHAAPPKGQQHGAPPQQAQQHPPAAQQHPPAAQQHPPAPAPQQQQVQRRRVVQEQQQQHAPPQSAQTQDQQRAQQLQQQHAQQQNQQQNQQAQQAQQRLQAQQAQQQQLKAQQQHGSQPNQPQPNRQGQQRAGNQPQPGQQQRLPQQRQQQLITEQRQRTAQYNVQLQHQTDLARQRSQQLQQQKRNNQYRFQQQYVQRLQQQQVAVRGYASYNYNSDPYFYTAPSYRYLRGGTYYQVNNYAADQLRQAVNLGYNEGFLAGQADRADGWRFDYQNSYAYQDANYGYDGRYVNQSDYNYYFREGMRRGYQDGYYARYQYGQRANGGVVILANILNQILNFQPL